MEAEYRHRAVGKGGWKEERFQFGNHATTYVAKYMIKTTAKDRTGTGHRYVPEKLGTNTEGF